MKKKALITFLLTGAVSMFLMSAHYLYLDNTGILKRKDVSSEWWYLVSFRAHVLFGLLAIGSGPFQFITRIRIHKKRVLRRLGYLYFASVFISSLAGFLVAPFAMGGWISSVGFLVLALLWFSVSLVSLLSISNGQLNRHMYWSYLSYGLTFAAITQRTLLLIPLLTPVPFLPIYQLSAWLPWIVNLTVANALFKRSGTERP